MGNAEYILAPEHWRERRVLNGLPIQLCNKRSNHQDLVINPDAVVKFETGILYIFTGSYCLPCFAEVMKERDREGYLVIETTVYAPF